MLIRVLAGTLALVSCMPMPGRAAELRIFGSRVTKMLVADVGRRAGRADPGGGAVLDHALPTPRPPATCWRS